MARRDKFHFAVRRGLEKDGWQITDVSDPLLKWSFKEKALN